VNSILRIQLFISIYNRYKSTKGKFLSPGFVDTFKIYFAVILTININSIVLFFILGKAVIYKGLQNNSHLPSGIFNNKTL